MKRFRMRFLGIAVLSVLLLAVVFVLYPIPKPPVLDTETPFLISVSEPRIFEQPGKQFEGDTLVPTGKLERRLEFTVSISNTVDADFQNVWFQETLNPEVQPFLADKLLTWKTETMPVSTIENVQKPNADSRLCTGFEHTWSILLTTAEDLAAYDHKTPDEIADALQSVTVEVCWKGGGQKQIFALKV